MSARYINLHRSCRRTRNQIASRAIPQREKERDVIRHLRQSPSSVLEGDTLFGWTMIARSPWSLLLFVIQQPNAAALAHSRVSRKLSGSGTSFAAPVATARVHNGGWLQQLRPGVTPWVNDDIYQAKLESQTRIAEATQEDSYALITAL